VAALSLGIALALPQLGPTLEYVASGASAVLLRFEPGASYGAHRHPEGEQYFVIEGEVTDGADTWGPGSYVWHPPGSVHAPRSKQGCLLFVSLLKPIEIVA
jgi:quercetin dioxygenase-like cupin family protein